MIPDQQQIDRSSDRRTMILGALGGPETFGGQAAATFLQSYAAFGDVAYFDTADAMFAAVSDGTCDAACIPEQTVNTGFHVRTQRRFLRPGSPLHVYAEVTHAYRCALLTKPGAGLQDITRVIGHTGSVSQSRAWLEEHLPQARIEVVDSNSLGAAQEVLAADGSVASVGTSDAARRVGLVELVTDIDGGSVGSYWAVGEEPRFAERPTRVVVTARSAGAGGLGDLVGALLGCGFRLQTAYSQPSGKQLYEHDYVLRFAGHGALSAVAQAVGRFAHARLAGAFRVAGG